VLRVTRLFGVKSLIVQLYGEPIGTPTHAEHCPHQREAKTRGMALSGVLLEDIFTATDDANDIYSTVVPGLAGAAQLGS
jgi:anti-sigma factor ChrR (cupin superfamily)